MTSDNCRYCGIDLAGSSSPCLQCRERNNVVEKFVAIGPWEEKLREYVSLYKYGGDRRLARWMIDHLFLIWKENWDGIPVMPVPPRAARLREEGFDPVGYLAAGLSKRGVPVVKLLRRKGNLSQKQLNREERLSEIALNFVLKRNTGFLPRKIVLLDDISTTGTTIQVCARILRGAGVQNVYAMVICKD